MSGCGYHGLDPLGGSSDGGRDALYCKAGEQPTIFAYTVRADWRRKLLEDCQRIRDAGHQFSNLIYVCTSALSTNEKDEARKCVFSDFGWQLDIYDLERIRVLLSTTLRHLIAQHPAIFCPPWFPQRGGLSIASSADTILIDHTDADHALATWLGRRLSLAGYRTWCYGTAPLAGENADESVRTLIQQRARMYLPVMSPEAIADASFMDRCGLASSEQVLPCWAANVGSLLPLRLARITPARFHESWATGLSDLLQQLDARGVAPSMDRERGRAIALRAYIPEPVTKPQPERVFANVFRVTVPKAILVYQLDQALTLEMEEKLRPRWAFSSVDPRTLFAFEIAPSPLPMPPGTRPAEYAWRDIEFLARRPSKDIVKELIRRSLDVACATAGLSWCSDRRVYYFGKPEHGERTVKYTHIDGRQTSVQMTGERQYGWGDRATRFRYQLGPRFKVGSDESGQWWVTTRLYVRVTDWSGACFQARDIDRRRKVVTRSWWNKEWLARMLAMMQALKSGDADVIQVGSGRRAVIVDTRPLEWECPVSIDLDALGRIGDFQEEMAALRFAIDDDVDDGDAAEESLDNEAYDE